jgi:deoxyhypusine synthase
LPPKLPELDLSAVKLGSLKNRPSKVMLEDFGRPCPPGGSFKAFTESLPDVLASADLKMAAKAIALAREKGRTVMLAMGGHPVKVGLSPLIIDLLRRDVLTSVSGNGSVMVHDSEAALFGATSEDVSGSLDDGSFGVTKETGALINKAAREAAASGAGLGRALGEELAKENPPHLSSSVIAEAFRLDKPCTIHTAIGSDVYNIHPDADGASLGKATMDDFHTFARLTATLEEGVFINLGSAVIMPEVFLKALSLTRNLGFRQTGLTTVNMDFIHQYRPRVNVVERPVQSGGKGYNFTGHHEIMLPLLMAMVLENLQA